MANAQEQMYAWTSSPNITGKLYPYDYEDLNEDFKQGKYAGAYGWDNSVYYGIAEKKANVDLRDFHSKRTKDEYFIPSIVQLVEDPRTRKHWKRIVTFNPYGLTSTPPTIAATTAHLNVPEIAKNLRRDGVIVNKEDGSINIVKSAIYYSWNIPGLADRLDLKEQELRDALVKYTQNEKLKDKDIKVFLPPVGGLTVYIFGDVTKIRDQDTEIAVRVHDSCCGSDVFGTDICTCRPYLVFAIQACVECAQRGGVGIVVYFLKEGRSLGEITKYRVYNARKNQDGGDRSDKYFFHTESIAGIRDARFQEMMPDVLNWLGLNRIDWLLSMSNEKYQAIVDAGIQVMQRVALPEMFVPKAAFVEMNAKIASGYHTDKLKSDEVIKELQDLRTIRKQCSRIYQLAEQGSLKYFHLNLEKLPIAVTRVVDSINELYPDLKIPYHSRLRHFGEKRMEALEKKWVYVDQIERTRRVIDLITVSVLLDAGAGPTWKYVGMDGVVYNRSEGIAVATYEMFVRGIFSSDPACKCRVNAMGIGQLTLEHFVQGFQISDTNRMVGLRGRYELITRLGKVMMENVEIFGGEIRRPGHLLDFVMAKVDAKNEVSVERLWRGILSLEPIFPEHLSGVRRGDVWCHSSLNIIGKPGSDLVPFHKLSQWLAISIFEPMELSGIQFTNVELFTALAEYRNGGLLIDTGVLELKNKGMANRQNDPGSELIVEWRAMTVCLIDLLATRVREQLGKTSEELPLMKVLEGGTWRAGRIIARELREDGRSPINFRSKGTVF